ncbi:MAG: hypothetical protein ABSD72_11055 [Terracidiphilus sp.]
MKFLYYFVLGPVLLGSAVACRKAELPDFVTADEKNAMETNPCWPSEGKGRIGVIYAPLYVTTSTKRNEIEWGSGENSKEWIGRRASTSEVVVFYDGRVWSPRSLPHDFDKSMSVVFSFDEKNIRFYDYVHQEGGYYERHPPEDWHDN